MNSKRGYSEEIRVKFNDGTYKLMRFGNPELVEVEEILGIDNVVDYFNVDDGAQLVRRLGIKSVTAFIYVGLKGMGGKLTMDEVSKQLPPTAYAENCKAIMQGMKLALRGTLDDPPEPKAEDDDEPDPTKTNASPGTGTASGLPT